MKLSTILDQIDMGSIALPEFQRGYVWSRDQVRKLMRSLYRGYPVGSLLMWETQTENADARGDGQLASGTVKLLLDGQQRITSLYGIVRGKPPTFFEGDESRFLNLYFNLETEEFEFYGPVKMRDDSRWISVTEFMQEGVGKFIQQMMANPEISDNVQKYINRLNAIENIKSRDFYVDNVTGEDMTVDTVVEIFNEVNSGGTKLSKGDLALAKICASYPQAREEMQQRLHKWERAGFYFKLDWLLRCVNTILTGEALFVAMKDIKTKEFRDGLQRAEDHIDTVLNLIASRLGLDHDRVLGSRYSIPLLVRYLDQRGGRLADYRERDRLLYWYIHTMLWGRYSGSTESILRRDLVAIEENNNALEALIEQLHQNRGDLQLYARDFEGWSRGNRFYPMLYMMSRVWHARDFATGNELKSHLLGRLSNLQLHHVFPKAKLYDHGYERAEVNAIANFTFLTQETNLLISDREPEEYFEVFENKHPGVLASHWIPMDKNLWKVENYLDLLAARRELLAKAANNFLDSLYGGSVPEFEDTGSILEREVEAIPGRIATQTEEELLLRCMTWMDQKGLPIGELEYELVDDETKEVLTVLNLAWTDGIQIGKSQPAALLIDEKDETLQVAQRHGYRCFTNFELFKRYVQEEILGMELAEA